MAGFNAPLFFMGLGMETGMFGWTEVNSVLSAGVGTMRVTNDGAVNGQGYQEVTVEDGKTYHVEAEVYGLTATGGRALFGTSIGNGSYSTMIFTGTGADEDDITVSGTSLFVTLQVDEASDGKYVAFDNISVREVL